MALVRSRLLGPRLIYPSVELEKLPKFKVGQMVRIDAGVKSLASRRVSEPWDGKTVAYFDPRGVIMEVMDDSDRSLRWCRPIEDGKRAGDFEYAIRTWMASPWPW